MENRERPGILTISAQSLTPAHLAAAKVPLDTPVQGVEGGHFSASILGNLPTLDTDLAQQEMCAGAVALCQRHPTVDCIVLECTNMPPYAGAIEEATGRRTVSILTAVDQLHFKER